jgi:hypothetical protein
VNDHDHQGDGEAAAAELAELDGKPTPDQRRWPMIGEPTGA